MALRSNDARAVAYRFRRAKGSRSRLDASGASEPAGFRTFPTGLRVENGILTVGSRGGGTLGNVVFLYELNANGKFIKRATLKPFDATPTDGFGTDVAVAGNAVVVGAPGQNAAYVFKRRSDGTWVETQKLLTADTPARGRFGSSSRESR